MIVVGLVVFIVGVGIVNSIASCVVVYAGVVVSNRIDVGSDFTVDASIMIIPFLMKRLCCSSTSYVIDLMLAFKIGS